MEIHVTSCADCPFCIVHYNDFEPTDDTAATCGLRKFQGHCFTISSCDTKLGEELNLDFPVWCPLEEIHIKRWM